MNTYVQRFSNTLKLVTSQITAKILTNRALVLRKIKSIILAIPWNVKHINCPFIKLIRFNSAVYLGPHFRADLLYSVFLKNVPWRQKMIPYWKHIGWPSYLAFYYLTFIMRYQNNGFMKHVCLYQYYAGLLHQSFNGTDIRHADSRWSINDYWVSENRLNFAMLLSLNKCSRAMFLMIILIWELVRW